MAWGEPSEVDCNARAEAAESDYEALLDAERRCLAATEAILRLLDAAEPFIPRKGNIGSREYQEWCEAAHEARTATRLDGEGE